VAVSRASSPLAICFVVLVHREQPRLIAPKVGIVFSWDSFFVFLGQITKKMAIPPYLNV
jgi:hypothetical protein